MSEEKRGKLTDEEMEKLRERQRLEQSIPEMCEFFSTLWWTLYSDLVAKGFKDHEALELVKAYIQVK